MLARDMIVTLEHPDRGPFMVPGCPVKMSDSPVELEIGPSLGMQTEEVLKELLHMTDGDLAELREQKTIP